MKIKMVLIQPPPNFLAPTPARIPLNKLFMMFDLVCALVVQNQFPIDNLIAIDNAVNINAIIKVICI